MPLFIEGNQVPARWARKKRLLPEETSHPSVPGGALRVVLVNNMPDAAMEDTEEQFFALIDSAADVMPVAVTLAYLPSVPRGERGMNRLTDIYRDVADIWPGRYDGVIITGTEPLQSDLRKEPYWTALAELFSWAERHTASAVLSCLAAHAGVLHGEGIPRHPLPRKMCGVFKSSFTGHHALARHAAEEARFPHSRWNEVRGDELMAGGYTLLTQSPEAGVDCFVKKKRQSLFLHFQGHPEYGARTLFKEYRRDVRRYLAGERTTYPTMPHGYFDETAVKALADFREKVERERHEELMAEFPAAYLTANLSRTWEPCAVGIYRNWLQYLLSRKTRAHSVAARPRVGFTDVPRQRFATSER